MTLANLTPSPYFVPIMAAWLLVLPWAAVAVALRIQKKGGK